MFSLHVHTHSPMCYDYVTAADNTCVYVSESWSLLLESGWGTGTPGSWRLGDNLGAKEVTGVSTCAGCWCRLSLCFPARCAWGMHIFKH